MRSQGATPPHASSALRPPALPPMEIRLHRPLLWASIRALVKRLTPEFIKPGHRLQIRSRHPTHHAIRDKLPRMPWPVIARFGSLTEIPGAYVELNSVEAVKNSCDKLRMKFCFAKAGVPTAPFTHISISSNADQIIEVTGTPVIAKHRLGSRGTGVYKLESKDSLNHFIKQRADNLEWFVFEQFRPYNMEFRCHTWAKGIFNTSRKALRGRTPAHAQWKFSHEHTVWLREANPQFNKPSTWPAIEEACIKAMHSCGLQFTGCDVKVDSKTGDFFIIELNSAPSFGDLTADAYTKQLPIIAQHQYETVGLISHPPQTQQ